MKTNYIYILISLLMRKYLFFFTLAICPLLLNGQSWTTTQGSGRLWGRPAEVTYADIEGTPFLYEDFEAGSLVTRDSIKHEKLKLRYNIYEDEVEFMSADNKIMIVSSPKELLFVNIGDRVFKYFTYFDGKRPRQGYFEVLAEGDCQVLLKREVVLHKGEDAKGYTAPRPPRFARQNDMYYIRFDKQFPTEVSLRRRSILQAFGKNQADIAGFVGDNNLSYGNPADLVKMADFYNRLTGK
jgi:hypothetical protein